MLSRGIGQLQRKMIFSLPAVLVHTLGWSVPHTENTKAFDLRLCMTSVSFIRSVGSICPLPRRMNFSPVYRS